MYVRMRGMESFGDKETFGALLSFPIIALLIIPLSVFYIPAAENCRLSDVAIVVFSVLTHFEVAGPLHSCVLIYLPAIGSTADHGY